MKALTLALSLVSTAATAKNWALLEPEYLSMAYKSYDKDSLPANYPSNVGVRDPYLDPLDDDIGFGLELTYNYNFVRYKNYALFHRNEWSFQSTESHVRHVKWEYDLGFKIGDHIQIYHEHMSRHILEATREQRFPVRDAFVISIIFIGG